MLFQISRGLSPRQDLGATSTRDENDTDVLINQEEFGSDLQSLNVLTKQPGSFLWRLLNVLVNQEEFGRDDLLKL